MMECKGCGIELSEYCSDCIEKMLSEGIAKLEEERHKKAKKGFVVYEGDPMYEAILARRDLDARKIT